MSAAFLDYVERLRRDNPHQSYSWCFVAALRTLHLGAFGSLDNAPPLPGSRGLDDMFPGAAAVEEVLRRLRPGQSQEWLREAVELMILNPDGGELDG
jgi:hypothetical protein